MIKGYQFSHYVALFIFRRIFYTFSPKTHGIRCIYNINNIHMIIYSNNIVDKILIDGTKAKYRFQYLYIISLIRIYRFKDRSFSRNSFIPINVDILRNILIYNKAHIFLKELVDLGIIECDEVYSAKTHKSRGYRLTEKVLEGKFYKVKEVCSKLIEKAKRAYEKHKIKLITEDDMGYGYVTLCMEDLKIDVDSALEEINGLGLTEEQEEDAVIAVENFNHKFFTKDKTGNRLHNNLTNLFTPMRKHLKYRGKELTQCDIRNSQLVFLYLAMKDYSIPEEEMKLFGEVVCEHGFYEYVAENLGVQLTEDLRKQFKVSVFKELLFAPNKSKLSEAEVVFKQSFPTIFYIIRRIKTKNYKDASIMLQKKESEFIFNCVRKMNKSIPLFTIHDSIATTVGNEDVVYNTMLSEFSEIFNISPKIKIEKFD